MKQAVLERFTSIKSFNDEDQRKEPYKNEDASAYFHFPCTTIATCTAIGKLGRYHLAKAIGSPLTGKDLDARLGKATSGKEKGIPASVAIKETRKRLGL
jgi:hypothetical protein